MRLHKNFEYNWYNNRGNAESQILALCTLFMFHHCASASVINLLQHWSPHHSPSYRRRRP